MTKSIAANQPWTSFYKSFKSHAQSRLATQPTDQWRPILRGLYEVSIDGEVRRWWRGSRSGYWMLETPKLVKQHDAHKESHVYRGVNLRTPSGGKRVMYVHSIVLQAFVGRRPARCEAAHFDGNGLNNKLSNLRWASYAEQRQDKERHGRLNQGESGGNSKLTEKDVLEIIRLRKAGTNRQELAAQFGVSVSLISHIEWGRRWAHLQR